MTSDKGVPVQQVPRQRKKRPDDEFTLVVDRDLETFGLRSQWYYGRCQEGERQYDSGPVL